MLRARNEKRQYAIMTFGAHGIRVDVDRKGDRSVEHTGKPLPAVNTGALPIVECLAAGNPDGVLLRFDCEVALADSRYFENCDEVIALLEDVDRRITTTGGSTAPDPITALARVERPLQRKESIERIIEA